MQDEEEKQNLIFDIPLNQTFSADKALLQMSSAKQTNENKAFEDFL